MRHYAIGDKLPPLRGYSSGEPDSFKTDRYLIRVLYRHRR